MTKKQLTAIPDPNGVLDNEKAVKNYDELENESDPFEELEEISNAPLTKELSLSDYKELANKVGDYAEASIQPVPIAPPTSITIRPTVSVETDEWLNAMSKAAGMDKGEVIDVALRYVLREALLFLVDEFEDEIQKRANIAIEALREQLFKQS